MRATFRILLPSRAEPHSVPIPRGPEPSKRPGNSLRLPAIFSSDRLTSIASSVPARTAIKFKIDDGSGPTQKAAVAADSSAKMAAHEAAQRSGDEASPARTPEQDEQLQDSKRLMSKVIAERRELTKAQRELETVEFPEIGLQRAQLERSGIWAPEPSLCLDYDDGSVGSEYDPYLDELLEGGFGGGGSLLDGEAPAPEELARGLPDSLARSSLLMASGALRGARVGAFVVES